MEGLFCSNDDAALPFDKHIFDLSYDYGGGDKSNMDRPVLINKESSILPPTTRSGIQLISDALQGMSLEERKRAQNDLHGVNFDHYEIDTKETVLFQQEKLEEMNRELQRLRASSPKWSLHLAAIEMAERRNIDYVNNPAFRVKFLRAENWDGTKAASRFIRHFDWKLELFGEDKLAKDIGIGDLQPEDVKILKKGYFQRLPERDGAGRALYFQIFNGQTYPSPECMARVHFYMLSALDEESDRRGGVLLAFKLKDIKFASNRGPTVMVIHKRTGFDMPIRLCSMHKFLEKYNTTGDGGVSRISIFIDAAINSFSPYVRARLRLHYGSYTEWMYESMTFRIPHHLIPLTADYKIKTKNHMEYLAMRQVAEDFLANGTTVMTSLGMITTIQMTDLPANNDVLLGKGKPIQEFRGNHRLSAIIDDYTDRYHFECSKTEKTALSTEMVQKVKEYHGRFLSKEIGVWIEVSDDLAREKVSHMFRHQRPKGKKGRHEMTGNHSTIRAASSELPPGATWEMNTNHKRIKVGGKRAKARVKSKSSKYLGS